jgi:hypothetical protein
MFVCGNQTLFGSAITIKAVKNNTNSLKEEILTFPNKKELNHHQIKYKYFC